MAYGNPLIGNSPSCNQFTKGHDKDKNDPTSYRGIYLNDTSPNSLKVSSYPDLRHTPSPTTLSPLTNLAPNLAHRHMTLSTLSFPSSNTTSIHFRNLHMWPLLTTPQPTPQCTETDCHPFSCTMALLVICGTTLCETAVYTGTREIAN